MPLRNCSLTSAVIILIVSVGNILSILIVLTTLLVISFSACSLLVVADFAVLFYFVVCKSFAAVCQ